MKPETTLEHATGPDLKFMELLGAPVHAWFLVKEGMRLPKGAKARGGTSFDDLQDFWLGAKKANDAGWSVYYHLNIVKEGAPFNQGRVPEASITDARGHVIDFDPPNRNDPEACEAFRTKIVEKMATFRLPPTAIIDSGGGIQLVWLFEQLEPFIIQGNWSRKLVDNHKAKTKILMAEVSSFLGGQKADHTFSVDHVFRAPGFINHKNGRVAHVVEELGPRYKSGDFRAAPQDLDLGATAVEIENIVRLAVVNDLDQWDVSHRVQTAILKGWNPDEPKSGDDVVNGKPDRSEWVFDVLCQLCRASVPDQVIVGIMTDPGFKISESVLEKNLDHLKRRIGEAKATVETGPLILHRANPTHSAREFVKRESPNLMNMAEDWLTYTGTHYAVLEDATLKSMIRRFLEAAKTPAKKEEQEPGPFLPTKSSKAEVLDALQDIAHLPKDRFEPPCWLRNEGPPALEILACQNGLLHVLTGELLPSSPDFFTRNALSFDYDAHAPEPKEWLKFLDSIWDDDSEVIDLLQEWMGYLLLPDTSMQKIGLLIGPPRSGKGIIAWMVRLLVGALNCCAPSANGLSGPFGKQGLLGKTVAIMSDVRVGSRTDKASVTNALLEISGEDSVDVQRKFKGPWSGQLNTRFMIMTNELPQLVDSSGALAGRMLPMVMTRSFLGCEDLGLKNRLAPEVAGVLLWALEGLKRLKDRGHFLQPGSSKEVIWELAEVGTPLATFLRMKCTKKTGAWVPANSLFEAWNSWQSNESIEGGPITKTAFTQQLKVLGIRKSRVMVDGERSWVYTGLSIK